MEPVIESHVPGLFRARHAVRSHLMKPAGWQIKHVACTQISISSHSRKLALYSQIKDFVILQCIIHEAAHIGIRSPLGRQKLACFEGAR